LERYQVVEALLADLGVEARCILVLSKADAAGGYDLEFLKERLGGWPVSVVKGRGLHELKQAVKEALIAQGVRPAAWAYVSPEPKAAVPASTD
jgi:GTP-binding protein HflX